ncbi:MAG: hypothetical protein RLZZ546_974 [Bacteroidota bacterium]|jgi:hypothetical protein
MAKYDFLNDIEETPIFQYYKKYGEGVAEGRTKSSLFAKYTLPNIIKRKTRNRITKTKLIEGHTLYWNHLGKLLIFLGRRGKPMSWGLYLDLCNEYELTPTTGYDKTTLNEGPSQPILVYRLTEVAREKYSSRKEVGRVLLNRENNACKIHKTPIDFDNTKKIEFTFDKFGRRCRFKLTGIQTQKGNRTTAAEVQVYELVEELIPYSNTQQHFPSYEEVRRNFGDLAILGCLNGKIYQSKGYRFKKYEEDIFNEPTFYKKENVGNPIENILVYKLVEIPQKIYNSIGLATFDIFGFRRSNNDIRKPISINNNPISYTTESKINFYIGNDDKKYRFKQTGKKHPVWEASTKLSSEIQAYELVEELIPYSDTQQHFPSEREIKQLLNVDVKIKNVLAGKQLHSKGYKFYKIN